MERFRLGLWVIDVPARTATRGAHEVVLSRNEARLLGYLAARGGPASRDEIRVEVFGYAPSVRSRAVDTALLRLRGKLEADPHEPELILSARGQGMWLGPVSTLAEEPGNQLPTPGSRYHPRPEVEARIVEALQAQSVVTVVGVGGAGKTRVCLEVARSSPTDVAFVGVRPGVDANSLRAALAAALGLTRGDTPALQLALASRPLLVLVDDAEQALDAVREVLGGLPEGRFLVASREALGLGAEGVVELTPWSREEARAFLEDRRRTGRWWQDGDAPFLAPIAAALGGHPLAIELVAAHPESLQVVHEQLATGRRWAGREAVQERLARSLAPLDALLRRTLEALAWCEADLWTDEIERWLGSEAVDAVPELASRSLLARDGRAWRVPRVVREAMAPADPDGLRASFVAWSVAMVRDQGARLPVDPAPCKGRWLRLAPRWFDCVPDVSDDALPDFALVLFRHADGFGPVALRRRIADLLRARLPDHPVSIALGVDTGRLAPDDPSIARVLQSGSTTDQALMLEILTSRAVPHVDRDALATLCEHPDLTELQALQLRADRLRLQVFDGAVEDALEPLRTLAARAEPYPALAIEVIQTWTQALRWANQPHAALLQLDRAAALARSAGLTRQGLLVEVRRAAACCDVDVVRGADVSLAAARRLEACGETGDACRVLAGLMRYIVGDLASAIPLLAHGASAPGRTLQALSGCISRAARYRQGETALQSALLEAAPATGRLLSRTGTGDALLTTLMRAEVALRTGDDPHDALAAVQEALTPEATPLARHLVQEQATRADGPWG